MRWYDWYWTTWLLVVFGGMEGWALASGHPERTFSEFIWRVCDVLPGQTVKQWTFVHYALIVTLIWLLGHLGWKLWR